jgi:hypothetical protein
MTTYKRVKVWDGTEWQYVGAQIPQAVEAYGSESQALTAGAATKAVTFTAGVFTSTPLVFTQVTGTKDATIRVTATSSGFTATLAGTGTDTITFDWFAIQPE